ncbi:hypothetical protein [Phytomonospora endophytica]|uniref:Uncharacterized protein n=1 Tax=Phytomonospora endophytica TaxID=714109 RepID=A0A841FK48_9ACTN|nr:hypothetical protein [Phytomonospora endophytica]MBB6037701.1 hypothetical protein [Phytomonospora endophytica]GIG67771.1 hypothetical protein Pen01_40660 [Phytomonospora endophytica]
MSEDEYHRPVEASADVLTDLWAKEEELDSYGLGRYAMSIGLTPPPEPEGFSAWAIIVAYPERDYSNPVLYWWGPENNPDDADLPEPADDSDPSSQAGWSDPGDQARS